jgi:hypothetical protein
MNRSRRLVAIALAPALLASGCPGSRSEDAAPSQLEELRLACAELARSWCSSAAFCRAATFETEYGVVEHCVERRAQLCEKTLFGAGSKLTPQQVRACASATDLSALGPAQCELFARSEARRTLPPECDWRGTLRAEAPCVVGAQCAEGGCVPTSGLCGRCRALRGEDDPCFEDGDCQSPLVCAESRCTPLRTTGAACGADHPCFPDLVCRGGVCAARRQLDESCDPTLDDCALWTERLGCNAVTQKCERLLMAGENDPCGRRSDGAIARCRHGLVCEARSYPDPDRGRCVPALEDGAFCLLPTAALPAAKYIQGGPCRAPAVCFQSQCQVPEAAACSAGQLP